MAANNLPIYSAAPDVQWNNTALTSANTAKDGTGTVTTVFTANATNGGYLSHLIARPLGTNVATVLRIFVNNGSSNATPANNILIGELTLAATTASEVAALADYEYEFNFALPAGYVINVAIGTAVAAGYVFSVIGGRY